MPIPALNVNGVLPPGVWPCSLDEVKAMFGQPNPHPVRAILWQQLIRFCDWIKPMGFKTIWVDGSFTTDKKEPGDVDVVLEAPGNPNNKNIDKRIFDPNYVEKQFQIHLLQVPGSRLNKSGYRFFFEYIRPDEAMKRGLPAGATKGILTISL